MSPPPEDFAAFERELRAFIAEHGQPGRMPLQRDLLAAGRADLMYALQSFGGSYAVAQHLGQAAAEHLGGGLGEQGVQAHRRRPHTRRTFHLQPDLPRDL